MTLSEADRQHLLERFLRYVAIDTQSAEGTETYPSTLKQKDLLALLADELRAVGLADVTMDEHGYVMATVPSNLPQSAAAKVPVLGLLAHVDTYPETPGANVKPQVIPHYDGGDIPLSGAPGRTLRPSENANLSRVVGHTVITTDGTTLLGADDKAGVAEIMTLVDVLLRHPEIPRGTLRIGFTPDEEVGQGTRYFDVKAFGAELAYTLDGSELGEIEDETFCADSATVTVHGLDVHPGYGKNKLINAARIASLFVTRIAAGPLPETTEGREGYLHPYAIQGGVAKAAVQFLVRDFELEGLAALEARLALTASELQAEFPGCRIDVDIKESYRNMKYDIAKRPEVIELACTALRRAGIEPKRHAIRGGTDGAKLSAMGLPTPNLFAGGQNFHSINEWVSLDWMVKATETLLALVPLYVETYAR